MDKVNLIGLKKIRFLPRFIYENDIKIVDGYYVEYKDLRLVIHKHTQYNTWVVSDYNSGIRLTRGSGFRTRQEAIDDAVSMYDFIKEKFETDWYKEQVKIYNEQLDNLKMKH